MVFKFFGKNLTEKELTKVAKTTKNGTTHQNIINTTRKAGFYCLAHENSTLNELRAFIDKGLPAIVNYTEPDTNEGHYAVIIGYTKNKLIMNDPWNGKNFKIKNRDFLSRWHDRNKSDHYNHWFLIISKKKFDLGKQYNPI